MVMNNNSRTINVVRNMLVGTGSQIITIFLAFVTRTVFIQVLDVEYLGVNGLFTNILLILSFAELGIGNAITFNLYKPLAKGDNNQLSALMNLYATAYKTIGIVIALAGLAVIPFMDVIIKDPPKIPENLNLIYLLFLFNTVLSYFFVYKKSIITADQKNYIVVLYNQIFMVVQTIGQIAILLLTHNYIIFLVIQILCTFFNNFLTARKADKLYPFLNKNKEARVTVEERQKIFDNIRALFMYKMGTVALNGTGNIIMSAMIGVAAVGLCSNYLLIIGAINNILCQFLNAFTASVGNLNAIAEKERKREVFEQICLIAVWLYGFASIGLMLFTNDLIQVWIGRSYLLPTVVLFTMLLNFYISGVQYAPFTYRTTMGLFVEGRWSPVAATVLNIGFTIFFAHFIGLVGIFLAASLSRMLTMWWVDPTLTYLKGFGQSPARYFLKYWVYLVMVVINFAVTKSIIDFIHLDGWSGLIVKAFCCVVITNLIFLMMFYKTKEFKSSKQLLTAMVVKLAGNAA